MLSLMGCNSTHITDVHYSFLKIFQVCLNQAGFYIFYPWKVGKNDITVSIL